MTRIELCNQLRELVGTPFRLGQCRPRLGMDCAGILVHGLRLLGENTPRTPVYSSKTWRSIDLLEYMKEYFIPVKVLLLAGVAIHKAHGRQHVYVCVDAGQMLHASARYRGVVITNESLPNASVSYFDWKYFSRNHRGIDG